MKKIIIMALMAVAILPTYAESTVTTIKADGLTNSEKKEKKEKNDTVRIRYIHRLTEDDARIFERNLQKTVIYVNDQVTTHLRQARRQPVRRQHCPSEAQVHANGQ